MQDRINCLDKSIHHLAELINKETNNYSKRFKEMTQAFEIFVDFYFELKQFIEEKTKQAYNSKHTTDPKTPLVK